MDNAELAAAVRGFLTAMVTADVATAEAIYAECDPWEFVSMMTAFATLFAAIPATRTTEGFLTAVNRLGIAAAGGPKWDPDID